MIPTMCHWDYRLWNGNDIPTPLGILQIQLILRFRVHFRSSTGENTVIYLWTGLDGCDLSMKTCENIRTVVYFAELFWGSPLIYRKTKYIFKKNRKQTFPGKSYLVFKMILCLRKHAMKICGFRFTDVFLQTNGYNSFWYYYAVKCTGFAIHIFFIFYKIIFL